MRMTAEYFETHGYEDQPDAADITRAQYSLFEGKVMDIHGYLTESFSEAPDDKKLRIAQAVLAQDPTEIGQVFLDLVDTYCKVTPEEAYLEAVRVMEFGEEA